MSITLVGFYFIARDDWERLLLCLLGFVVARLVVTWLTRRGMPHRPEAPMRLSTDEMIFWQHGFIKLNGTIVFTWGLMFVLAVGSKLITRKLSTDMERSRWQNLLEIVVTGIGSKSKMSACATARIYRLSGHAVSVRRLGQPLHRHSRLRAADRLALDHRGAGAVRVCGRPFFGIEEQGLGGYLKSYVEPTVIMLPFNIISELSRTLALAVRLFGNMMSGAMILAILLTITPFLFPIVMTALGLLTGMVQAYIFSILAAVYIAAATRVANPSRKRHQNSKHEHDKERRHYG